MVLIGTLAFSDSNRAQILSDVRMLTAVRALAEGHDEGVGEPASFQPPSQVCPKYSTEAQSTR